MGKMTLDEISTNCFFRYRDFNNNTLEELLTGNVWHSKPSLLNDPFEFHFDFDWDTFTFGNFIKINQALQIFPFHIMENLYLGNEIFRKQLFDKLKQEVERVVIERKRDIDNVAFLCCFASSFDNPLMWSHYANGMQGLCIAYKKDIVKESNDFERIIPIEYVVTPNKIDYSSLSGTRTSIIQRPLTFDLSHKAITPAELEVRFNIHFKSYQHMFQKHSRWEYEGEYRNVVIDRTREGASGCLKNIGENAIGAIIFGYRMPQDNIQSLESICRDKGITMYKALPRKSDYSVILEEHTY
ncbi:TPA: DUF2971 domain-containing protein [Vibrio antiquarius]